MNYANALKAHEKLRTRLAYSKAIESDLERQMEDAAIVVEYWADKVRESQKALDGRADQPVR